MWKGDAHGESERETIPNRSSSSKVDFATASWDGEKRQALAERGGPVVWIGWVVVWEGFGQEVDGEEVMEGNCLRRLVMSRLLGRLTEAVGTWCL
jgi:hypothetical protein